MTPSPHTRTRQSRDWIIDTNPRRKTKGFEYRWNSQRRDYVAVPVGASQ